MSRRSKIWTWIGASLAALLLILGVATILIVKSPWFGDYVRGKIISTVEESTGGKAEVGSFAFDWSHLQATIRNFVLHGSEGPNEAPLFRADQIVVRLKLLAGLRHAVDLEYLGVQRPSANVIVYPGGKTNVPAPNVTKKSDKSALETVVDLAIHKFDVSNGTAAFRQESAAGGSAVAFSGHGENLQANLQYRAAPAGYQGDVKIGSLQVASNNGQPLNAALDLPVEIGKDSIEIKKASLATKESQIHLRATVSNMNAPEIQAAVTAHVSLPEVQRTANIDMDTCKRNTPCFADADIAAHVKGQDVQVSKANVTLGQSTLNANGTASGIQFQGKVDVAEIGRLFRITGDPRGEVALNGKADVRGGGAYALTATVAGRGVGAGSTRLEQVTLVSDVNIVPNQIDFKKIHLAALGGEFNGSGSLSQLSLFRATGRLQNFNIREVERQLLKQTAGYDGTVSGDVEAVGDLKAKGSSGTHAEARLAIAPGSRGVPVSGRIQAAYDGARNTVELGRSFIRLPHSLLDIQGTLGKLVNVDFTSTDTRDLYPALAIASNPPPSEMPVTLQGGKIALHAVVSGPLATPVIDGQIEANRFSVTRRPFDRLSASFSASPSRATVENGVLARQGVDASFSGSVGLNRWTAGMNSPLSLTARLTHGDIADVLALAGQSDIPGRGTLDASAQIGGSVGNPQGSVQIAAADGAFYGEPFNQVDLHVDLADQLIRLTSFDVIAKAGQIRANGTYNHPRNNLLAGQAQLQLTGSGIQLENLAILSKYRPGLSGTVQLASDARGTVSTVGDSTAFDLTSIRADAQARGLRDQKQTYGDLTAHADTAGTNVNFNVDSGFAGSSIRVTGQTALAGDYPTTASLQIQNLRIESVLALADRSLPAQGVVGLTGNVSGTIKNPSRNATANVEFNLARATLYGESINSLQATLRYSPQLAEIDSLRATAPAGNLNLNASFSHPADRFDSGRIQVHAESSNLRLDRVRTVQDRKPGIAGVVKLLADFTGDLRTVNGATDVAVSKLNADVSADELAYNGHSLGKAQVTAGTNGRDVVFKADSNFAGSAIHADGDVRPEGDYPVNAKLTIGNVRYSNLQAFLGSETTRPGFEALLEANASLAGPARRPADLNGSLDITRLELTTPASPVASAQAPGTPPLGIRNDGPIQIAYARSKIQVKRAHLTGPSTDINVAGTAALTGTRALDLSVKANADLAVLQQIETDIHSSGAVTVDAALRGTLNQPVANGTVQLKNAAVNMESLPNGIYNANGVIALNGTSASIRNLTAESAGGKITLSGFVALIGEAARYSLRANVDHVRTRYQGFSVINNANVSLTGTNSRSLLSGTVTVQRLGFNPQSDIGSMLSELTTSAAPNVSNGINGPLAVMRLDIRIRTAPDVRFETTMAESLQANADLNLVGTVARPGMVGRVDITQGDLIFFRNEYTVDRGVINFYNPAVIDPQIDIGLKTTVESVAVTLQISGPMNNLKISYHSDPPLQFQDIVGLLVSGKRPTSDPNIVASQPPAPQQSLGEMGETAVVSQAVAAPLSQRLQRVFGVNQLRIDPTFASGSALPQLRLSLQQRIANSLTFTYTQDLSQSNSELVRVEWAVSPRFSAVATRDENGIFGVDFFYKRQFR